MILSIILLIIVLFGCFKLTYDQILAEQEDKLTAEHDADMYKIEQEYKKTIRQLEIDIFERTKELTRLQTKTNIILYRHVLYGKSTSGRSSDDGKAIVNLFEQEDGNGLKIKLSSFENHDELKRMRNVIGKVRITIDVIKFNTIIKFKRDPKMPEIILLNKKLTHVGGGYYGVDLTFNESLKLANHEEIVYIDSDFKIL